MSPAELLVAHTSALDAADLAEVRAMVFAAFDGSFDDEDWDHALGGIHAVVTEDGRPVAHGAVVQRSVSQGLVPYRVGYVEAVAVAAGHRRRGLASQVMEALEPVVRSAYDLGALGASAAGVALYNGRGWVPWRGPLSVLAPDGPRPTPDDEGGLHVLDPPPGLDLDGPLACDWRSGDVW